VRLPGIFHRGILCPPDSPAAPQRAGVHRPAAVSPVGDCRAIFLNSLWVHEAQDLK
jgi:hypothetical protein